MMVIDTERIPIKLWLDDIEPGALEQAKNLANFPYAFKHIAIMPDAHQGFGMPIGGVMATQGVIIPNAVGVDIGCGMCSVRTNLETIGKPELERIIKDIKNAIPVAFRHHAEHQQWEGFNRAPDIPIIQNEIDSAQYQLGTLGGGNHFIEIQKGDDGYIWIMLHSGSRNFGYKIAREYHQKAKFLCRKRGIHLPDSQLSFLSLEEEEAKEYERGMGFALEFAQASRDQMMETIMAIIKLHISSIAFEKSINILHNYAAREFHFGQEVIVHRKGATSAKKGELGIIPGAQGTRSYIVRGKGNPESFQSCSHGAGRRLGRREAQRVLNLEREKQLLDKKGIIHGLHSIRDLDEASGAYKDIGTVIANQLDLIEVLVELTPLAVIKG